MDEKALAEGISFDRKKNWDKKKDEPKPDEELPKEPEQPKPDIQQLLRQERLGKKHSNAVAFNVTGGAFNVGGLFVLISGAYTNLINPENVIYFELANEYFGFPYTQEQVILFIEEWKAHLMGLMVSFQTFLTYYQQLCKQMKLKDTESIFQVINEQCGKMIEDLS